MLTRQVYKSDIQLELVVVIAVALHHPCCLAFFFFFWQVMISLVTRCGGPEILSMHLCCDNLGSPSKQQSMMSSNHANAEAPADAETSFSTKI